LLSSLIAGGLGAIALLTSPNTIASSCGYCVSPESCDQRPSRFSCKIISKRGEDGLTFCALGSERSCTIQNPTRVGGLKNSEEIVELEQTDYGVLQAVYLRVPVEELPVVINLSAAQYRQIATLNPHAALGLLEIMNEGKTRDDPMVGMTFSSRAVNTQVALEAWTAAITSSKLLPALDGRREVVQISMERTLEKDGSLLIDFDIVHKTEALVETGRSYFQFRLAPAYAVRPSRPVYNMSAWQVAPARTRTNIE
jgi:hypothetical protein